MAKPRHLLSAVRTLDLGLDIVNGIGALDLESDGLAREGLYENLHGGLWWL